MHAFVREFNINWDVSLTLGRNDEEWVKVAWLISEVKRMRVANATEKLRR